MITINFKCEACGGNRGNLIELVDEPFIECDNEDCGEVEVIRDYDIVGNN